MSYEVNKYCKLIEVFPSLRVTIIVIDVYFSLIRVLNPTYQQRRREGVRVSEKGI